MNRKDFLTLGLSSLGLSGGVFLQAAPIFSFGDIAAQKMCDYGRNRIGKKMGGGTSDDFMQILLKFAGAKPGQFVGGTWVWGSPVKGTGRPNIAPPGPLINKCMSTLPYRGEIVQFDNCQFKVPNGIDTMHNHAALVVKADGYVATLVHQNIDGKQFVQETTLDMSSLITPTGQGRYTYYVPLQA
jgi:hypothetical protein